MTFYTWFQLSIVCLLGAMSPGPSVVLIISNTISKNRINGIITSIGHGLGVTLYALFAILGLEFLIKTYYNVFIGFQILGSIFLILIGLNFLLNKKVNNIDEEVNDKIMLSNSFLQGFMIAFLNPKILVFFAALFSQFINVNANISERILLVLTPGIIDTIWYIFISISVTSFKIKNFIFDKKNILEKLMGLLLILVALTILLRMF